MRLLPPHSGLGWTPYGWLIYLAFLFIQPVASQQPTDWAIVGVSLAVFLPLYFRAHWLEGRRLLPVVLAILVLGVALVPWNAGAAGFFIYAASFAGRLGPPRIGLAWLLGIVVLVGAEHLLVGIDYWSWAAAIVFSLLVGGVGIHFAEVGRSNSDLRLAHDEVERLAKLHERERIARDLHDLLGHSLSVITLKSELAGRYLPRDVERAKREIAEVEGISRRALAEVREAVQGIREGSLASELPRAKLALASAGVELDLEPGPYLLDSKREAVAVLALREAVTNIVRHAAASRCQVHFGQENGCFRLVVHDDGRGGEAIEGSGLAGMRERVEEAGGNLRLERDGGWKVRLELPTGDLEARRAGVLGQ